jgi:phage-related protein
VTQAINQDEKDRNFWKLEDHNKQAILIMEVTKNRDKYILDMFYFQVACAPVPYDVDGPNSLNFSKLNNTLTNDAGRAILDDSIT